MPKILKIEELKEKAILKHNSKYDYSNTIYSAGTLLNIFCYKHGYFNQNSYYHLKGCGCSKCYNRNKTDEDIINEFINKQDNKYDYSLVKYCGWACKVKIICKEHGIFEQSPNNHLKGKGCPVCTNNKKHTRESFILKANEIHNNKYDYSSVEYKSGREKVRIVCPDHQIFEQIPNSHLQGVGCPRCVRTKTTEDFIEKANKIHNNLFKYDNANFINAKTIIKIICLKHGEFEQTPNAHLSGHGCPYCNESKGERKIREFLIENKIKFINQKRFDNCKDIRPLPFDFYLPNFNICIEYHGIQHYKENEYFGGIKSLKELQKRDKIKEEFCQKNNIQLITISCKDFNKIEEILLNTDIFKK